MNVRRLKSTSWATGTLPLWPAQSALRAALGKPLSAEPPSEDDRHRDLHG
jgi:hypothetical protein